MIRQKNGPRFAMVFFVLLPALACRSQPAPAGLFNTAGAGARAADIEAAVGVICSPSDITRAKDGSVSGCRVCPKGTGFYRYGRTEWEMYAETPGHFTSPHDNNLLLNGIGCDPDESNNGGSFMFTLKSGKPRLLKYNQGLITSRCHKFAYPDGRDFLVCRGGSYLQGEGHETVFMASFDAVGTSVTRDLIVITDMTGTCSNDPRDVTVVQEADIKDIQFALQPKGSGDPGKSGEINGMTITATLGNVRCPEANMEEKMGKLPASVKTYKIEFLFDGKHFKVAPTSRAALNRFSND